MRTVITKEMLDDGYVIPEYSPELSCVQILAAKHIMTSWHQTAAESGATLQAACKAFSKGDPVKFLNLVYVESVTLVTPPIHRPRHIPKEIRERVLSVGVCAFCGTEEFPSVDHIIPLARGGTHDEWNLQRLCRPCNSKKGARL